MFENKHHFEHGGAMKENPRQAEILDLLHKNGRMTVRALAKTLYVTEMTVRRDLAQMENGGYLKRYRGGAVLKADVREMPINERFFMDEGEKKELCLAAAAHLEDGMTVFLDSSSTCLYIIPHLCKYKGILVVTNSVKALTEASAYHIPCILIGGEYYAQDMCLIGPIAEQYTAELHFDVAFMTTAAYSENGIISDFDIRQTMVRRIAMKNAKKKIFLFEKSKLGKRLTYILCRKEDADAIITL